MNVDSWKISKSFTLEREDIAKLEALKLHKEESQSSVVRRLIRAADPPQSPQQTAA